jgi:hypothetical protein
MSLQSLRFGDRTMSYDTGLNLVQQQQQCPPKVKTEDDTAISRPTNKAKIRTGKRSFIFILAPFPEFSCYHFLSKISLNRTENCLGRFICQHFPCHFVTLLTLFNLPELNTVARRFLEI